MTGHDVIIVGAGSVGLPTACFLAEAGLRVLVLESLPSSGQGQNKAAIGGVRATHSDPAKIRTCQLSLDVFSAWKDLYGDDIHFQQGGYCFPVYAEEDEIALKELLAVQKSYGLDITWIDPDGIREILPGIDRHGLLGGTFSPGDGNISPILAARAFYDAAVRFGAKFRFGERVTAIECGNSSVVVRTTRSTYSGGKVLNAAGAEARAVGKMMGLDLPVEPDSHEGGVTDAVRPFFAPLVVDMREFPGSKNFYFYQEKEGHVVFCLTPEPLVPGFDRDSTSAFLPKAAQRLIRLFPRLRNIRVRRIWRGLYPMTPDGVPIVGKVDASDVQYVAVGFCGQGLMLGPGIARNIVGLITMGRPVIPEDIFASYSLYRDYSRPSEALK
jgi:sarcosine oxidase subunit beta